jgi:hypothetical protein
MRRPLAAHEQESATEFERELIDEPLTRILENQRLPSRTNIQAPAAGGLTSARPSGWLHGSQPFGGSHEAQRSSHQ